MGGNTCPLQLPTPVPAWITSESPGCPLATRTGHRRRLGNDTKSDETRYSTKLVSLRGYGSYGWQSTTPARRPSGHKINRRPFQRSEDLETPAESEEDDHLETASAEDPPTTTEDPKRPTSENTATWPDPWPPFGTIDFSKPSSSWVLPNLRVEPPAIDLKTLQSMMLRDMAVMSQNPPPRTEVRDSPESSDGG